MNTAPLLWEAWVVNWKVLGGDWMGGFSWAIRCKISIWHLKIRLFTSCLNLTFRIEQERHFSSGATVSPKISSSPFSYFLWGNCWLFLQVFVNSFKNFCWIILLCGIFFYFFSLPEQWPGTILDPFWFLFGLFLGLAMLGLNLSFDGLLWCIWLCVWHSTCAVIRNCRRFIFFVFSIGTAIYVVIIIL